MNETIVRIEQVEIRNFKNVVHGIIGFKNTHKSYKASVLGLYLPFPLRSSTPTDNRRIELRLVGTFSRL